MTTLLRITATVTILACLVTLFLGAYGGVLNPQNPVEFYSLTITLLFASIFLIPSAIYGI